jgi:cell division protein FtsN
VAPLAASTGSGIPIVPAPPPSATQVARYLQAGLFKDPINAATMREQLSGMGIANVQLKSDQRNGDSVSRVLIGPFFDEEALTAVRKRLLEVQLPALPVIE